MKLGSDDRIRELRRIQLVRAGDENAFKEIFSQYYTQLTFLAADFVGSHDMGREIVQEVFLSIWEMRKNWNPRGPLKPYLYQSVCNRVINYVRKENSRRDALQRYYQDLLSLAVPGPENESEVYHQTQRIWKAVNKLPRRRYLIFTMHKLHGLSYREIAESMDISVKTVENQMGRALKFLREEIVLRSSTRR